MKNKDIGGTFMGLTGKSKRRRATTGLNMQIDTLLGPQTTIEGDLQFAGGLHIDGVVKGNVMAGAEGSSSCHVSDQGRVVGELRVPNVHIDGTIDGDVYSTGLVELAENARINGNVYYNLIDVAVGAQVNGQLVFCEPGGEVKTKPATSVQNNASGEDSANVPVKLPKKSA